MESKFIDDIEKRKSSILEHNKTANIISIFKMALFILICYNIYKIYVNHYPLKLILLLIVEIVIFIIASLFHKTTYEQLHKAEGIIKIDEANIKRISGEWSGFTDIGEEFIDYDHPYATDLDIVGKNSLFQMINSTGTYYGRRRFVKDLLSPNFSDKEIQKRHEAITELSKNYDFSVETEYNFSLIGVDEDFANLISQLQDKKRFIESKSLKLLFKVSSIITCLALLYALVTKNTLGFIILNCLIIFQLLLWIIGYLKANSYVGTLKKLAPKISHYDDVINNITKVKFTSNKLNEIEKNIEKAKVGVNKLSKIASNINQRNNGVMCIILNALLLWDYKNAIDLDNWKQEYYDSVESWFHTLGELESLISFANLPRVCNNMCLPTFTEKSNIVEATNMGHPLIANDKRICNDFNLDNNIYIISGSNMSGKTTFMRTVGINMVLACSGSYVCANSMLSSKMNIITSMRIKDDLNEGISTFYAELKRIKKIINQSNINSHTLFLIDEIFRGTNSIDRLKGAEGVLRELCKCHVSGMITTHDLDVCNLEKENPNILNCSFNEHYIDNEIYFDYKLKKGKSLTTNAEFLLKKVGILS
ncbi:MutS-related protein [Terrisporobacter vanillatitrophus]|uniref:MutS-related protein n=1 Tax=Terrisporobacter vanillatitrophus TaxID=3058402 RepID=UPI003365D073